MEKTNLYNTKKSLSILFVFIVFIIAIILELTFFWVKYININSLEKKDFLNNVFSISKNMEKNISKNNLELNFFKFSNNEKRFQKFKLIWWPQIPNIIITDKLWNIISWNIWEKIDKEISFNWIENDRLIKKWDLLIFKVDLNDKDVYFFKKLSYTYLNFFTDLIFFIFLNIIFAIWIYFIWYIFVSKNLKPLEDILDDLKSFIHNANHELKTPLSVINSNLWLLKTTKNYEEDLVLDSIKEVNKLWNLLDELSSLSNITISKEKVELNLSNKINDILKEYDNDIKIKNLKVNLSKIDNIILNSNKYYFYIFFSNLLKNAIKYNFKNWEIDIILQKNTLIIKNTWELIKENEYFKIFDRFYKWDNSRNSEWFWIWLSLVSKIANIYNWQVEVKVIENKNIFIINF